MDISEGLIKTLPRQLEDFRKYSASMNLSGGNLENLDKSVRKSIEGLARQTARAIAKSDRFVVGDISHMPFGKRFGVCVVNEVLTYVPSAQRRKVVSDLADNADRFLIVDRCRIYRQPKKHENSKDKYATGGGYVNPLQIKQILESKGFEVEIEFVGNEWVEKYPDNYFIIKARRK